jgi:ABC-type nickel/cobalt efflux system permease component RcnA
VEKFKGLLILALVGVVLFPLGAQAHPMGNFSINHYSRLTVGERRIQLEYILDFAEIPTFQMFPEIRSGIAGVKAAVGRKARTWIPQLQLTADGMPLQLDLDNWDVEVHPGAAGLSTLRATFHLTSHWDEDARSLRLVDRNFPERIGWKEVVIRAVPPIGFPDGNPFATDGSSGLSNYPEELLAAAPNVVDAMVRIAPVPSAGAPVPATAGILQSLSPRKNPDRLSTILAADAVSLRALLLGILVAFSLGALHALSPGHGKTVVASFLVGARGTARHAVLLGTVVTFTHTAGVFLLGIAVLFLSDRIVPEHIYPWIGFFSGLTILAVGVNLFRRRLGGLQHDHGSHGGSHGHSHDVPDRISSRNLLAMGFSGGIVPCPSALVVLLSAVAMHRVVEGLLFIVAFSLGLASVLVAIGILVVRASRLLSRFDANGRTIRYVPIASAAIISVLGLGMALQSISGASLTAASLLLTGQAVAVLGLGLFLGLKHATDADHVVAVTTFVSQETSLLRSCWIGVFWGVGHTLSLAVAGILVIGLKVNFSAWLSDRLELGVAVMLVGLGLNVVVKTLRSSAEIHRHGHVHNFISNSEHSHWHVHLPGAAHEHSSWSHLGWRPMLTGVVHGAAGSAALMLLVLSTIRSPLEAFLYILIFGLGSILGMLAISLLLAVPLHWAKRRVSGNFRPVQLLAGVFSCAFGLFLGASIWMSLR